MDHNKKIDYNEIILEKLKDEEALHKISTDLKKEYSAIARAMASGNNESAALIVGAMERDINLLVSLDNKINGGKDIVNVA